MDRPPKPPTWAIVGLDWDRERRVFTRWWVKERTWRWWVPYGKPHRAQWWESTIGWLHEDGSVSMKIGPKDFTSEAEAQTEVDRRNAEEANA